MGEFLGYEPDDLVGKSIFEFHHALDSPAVNKAFKCLFSKGQSETGRYRFLACGGGYAWVLTQATLIYSNKAHKPQSVVCVNYVISGIENRDEVYSCSQLSSSSATQLKQKCATAGVPAAPIQIVKKPSGDSNQEIAKPAGPISVTRNIFRNSPVKVNKPAPTVVQNKGFAQNTIIIPSGSVSGSNSGRKLLIPLAKSTIQINAYKTPIVTNPSISAVDKSDVDNNRVVVVDYCPPIVASKNANGKLLTEDITKINLPEQQNIKSEQESEEVEKLIKTLSESKPFPNSNSFEIRQPQLNIPERSSSGPQSSTLKVFASAPTKATSKIFAPKTKDMNKGYLMYSDDESGLTMLKDEPEPEDLTHLAPTAGDVCIPLNSSHLFSDVLDTLLSGDSYCPLLSEASKEITPVDSPFVMYRDDLSNSGSLSPALTHSPGGCSVPSLCSLGEDSPPIESNLLGLELVDSSLDTDDFTVKAPYIPMNECDDLPLLTTDLMWGAGFNSNNNNSTNTNNNNNNCTSCLGDSNSMNSKNFNSNGNNSIRTATNYGWMNTKSCNSTQSTIETKLDHDSSLAKLLRADTNPIINNKIIINNSSYNYRKGGLAGGGNDYEKRKRSGGPDIGRISIKRSKQQPSISRSCVLDGGGKNNFCSVGGPPNINNRMNGSGLKGSGPIGTNGDSVLKNLLVSGCDVSAGYVCLNSRRPYSSTYAAVYRNTSRPQHAYS